MIATCYEFRTRVGGSSRVPDILREFVPLGTLRAKPEDVLVRGGTRVPCDIPVTLTSVDPRDPFSQSCHVILANLRGCAARSPRPVESGTLVHLEGLPAGLRIEARVVHCISLGEFEKIWLLGLALVDKSGNVWGLEPVPEDWAQK